MDHDEALNKALKSYAAAEPAEGFCERILQGCQPRRIHWAWAGVPVLAAAVWVVCMPRVEPLKPYGLPGPTVVQDQPAVVWRSKTRHVLNRRIYRVRAAKAMNAQEKALLRWATESPEAAADWMAEKDRADAPLNITELNIELISIEEREP